MPADEKENTDIRLMRGSYLKTSQWIPNSGEPMFDTVNGILSIGDGVTPGGITLNTMTVRIDEGIDPNTATPLTITDLNSKTILGRFFIYGMTNQPEGVDENSKAILEVSSSGMYGLDVFQVLYLIGAGETSIRNVVYTRYSNDQGLTWTDWTSVTGAGLSSSNTGTTVGDSNVNNYTQPSQVYVDDIKNGPEYVNGSSGILVTYRASLDKDSPDYGKTHQVLYVCSGEEAGNIYYRFSNDNNKSFIDPGWILLDLRRISPTATPNFIPRADINGKLDSTYSDGWFYTSNDFGKGEAKHDQNVLATEKAVQDLYDDTTKQFNNLTSIVHDLGVIDPINDETGKIDGAGQLVRADGQGKINVDWLSHSNAINLDDENVLATSKAVSIVTSRIDNELETLYKGTTKIINNNRLPFGNSIPKIIFGSGSSGKSLEPARADHVHPAIVNSNFTINGDMTVNGAIIRNVNEYTFGIPPSTDMWPNAVSITSNDGKPVSFFGSGIYKNGVNSAGIWCYPTKTGGATCTITCNIDANGSAYTSAPTPPISDWSTKIATTEFVKRQNYATVYTTNDLSNRINNAQNTANDARNRAISAQNSANDANYISYGGVQYIGYCNFDWWAPRNGVILLYWVHRGKYGGSIYIALGNFSRTMHTDDYNDEFVSFPVKAGTHLFFGRPRSIQECGAWFMWG